MKWPRRNEKRNPFRFAIASRILCLPLLLLIGTLVYIFTMGAASEEGTGIYDPIISSLVIAIIFIILVVMQYFVKVGRGVYGVRIVGVFVTTFVPWNEIVKFHNGIMVSLVDTAGKKHRMWVVQQANAFDAETSLPARFERQLEAERLEFAKQREADPTASIGRDKITKHPTWINLIVAAAVLALTFYSCWFYETLPWQF